MTIEELNASDVFARENGISLTGKGISEMVVTERHLNGAGVCQGGAIFTLADLSQAGLTQGGSLTVGAEIHFVHSARTGDHLTAVSEFVHNGKLPLVRTEVHNGDGMLIAVMTGSLYGI